MNASRLLEYFDRISEAPDAIPKLRKFILHLACTGRLVRQDPEELPPTADLLRAQTALSAKSAQRPRANWKTSAPIDAEEVPDSIPANWVAARLNDTGLFVNGLAFKPSDWHTSGRPIIRIQNLSDPSKEFNYARGEFPDEVIARDGDILVSWSATLDAFVWNRGEGVVNQHIFRVISAEELVDVRFHLLLLKRAIADLGDGEHAHGLVMTHINRGPFLAHVVAIPPLAEQYRIVAKVDELMGLCDRLEEAQGVRNALRDSATRASISAMTSSGTTGARRYLSHIEELTARPEQIELLRSAVVDLALRGHLEEQVASDQSANVLLREVATEIERSREATGLATPAAVALDSEEAPFAVPSGWAWARLSQLFNTITDGDHLPPPRADEGVAFLTIGNVSSGTIDFSECRLVPPEYFKSLALHRRPAQGDILYTVVGATYGRPVIVDADRDFCVQRHIAILKPAVRTNLRFLFLLPKSSLVYDQASRSITGTAQPTIPIRALRDFVVPVPPIEEQERIMAKVDALVALCDQLGDRVVSARKQGTALLSATLTETTRGNAEPAKPENPISRVFTFVPKAPSGDSTRMRTKRVPIQGTIAAGVLTFAEQQTEGWLEIPLDWTTKVDDESFALRVKGDSMNLAEICGKRIEPGDLVLVSKNLSPRPGTIVAARLDGESVLKRLVTTASGTVLRAESTSVYPDIPIGPGIEIQGVVKDNLKSAERFTRIEADEL